MKLKILLDENNGDDNDVSNSGDSDAVDCEADPEDSVDDV